MKEYKNTAKDEREIEAQRRRLTSQFMLDNWLEKKSMYHSNGRKKALTWSD